MPNVQLCDTPPTRALTTLLGRGIATASLHYRWQYNKEFATHIRVVREVAAPDALMAAAQAYPLLASIPHREDQGIFVCKLNQLFKGYFALIKRHSLGIVGVRCSETYPPGQFSIGVI